MANPQPTDAQLRMAHSISEAVKAGGLRKSTAQRLDTLPVLIAKGIMPRYIPCNHPCKRAIKSGEEYLFSCESCLYGKENPYFYSQYCKAAIPEDIRWLVWERDNFTCQNCGVRRFLTVDHIVPESAGGTMVPDNLQTLCKSCNSRKGARIG